MADPKASTATAKVSATEHITPTPKPSTQPSSIPTIIDSRRELWTDFINPGTKMMSGTITATAPLPSAGTSKLTYDTHPHIIEHMMGYCSTNVLLAFRAGCRRLRNRADKLFGSHIELSQDDLHLKFETPGHRVIKGQRIPAWRFRPHNVRYYIEPTPETMAIFAGRSDAKFDHRVAHFTVHHKHAQWFAEFLEGIDTLDIHGSALFMILPGVPPRTGPDKLGEVVVKGVKIPTLRFLPSGGGGSCFAAAVPFTADTVHYLPSLHIDMGLPLKNSWFFWPKWVPQCRRVVHEVNYKVDQRLEPMEELSTVCPFPYPPSCETVTTVFVVTKAFDLSVARLPASTPDDPGSLPGVTFLTTMYRICGGFQPKIQWIFKGLRSVKLTGDAGVISPDDIPYSTVHFLALCKAQREAKSVSGEEFEKQMAEIASRMKFID